MENNDKVIFFDLFDTMVRVDRGILEPYFDRETDRMGDNGTLKNAKETIEHLSKINPSMPKGYSNDQLAKYYENCMSNSLKNAPKDVLKMLKSLKEAGYKLCVISDAAYVDIAGWSKSPLSKYFDKTIFSCEVGYVKPDPKLFETALRAMGNPQHTVFIGDGGHEELQGAQKAGMQTIKAEWIKNRREEELYAHSNFRLQSTEQVLETVNSIDFTKQQVVEAETQQQEPMQQPPQQPDIDDFISSFNTENKTTEKFQENQEISL